MQFLPKRFILQNLACALCFFCLQGMALASDAAMKASLQTAAQRLVQNAANNVLPKQSHKAVVQERGSYAARYVSINTKNVHTEIRKGQGQSYVGIVKYQEQHFVCRGATKAAALKAPCSKERTRNMTEIIPHAQGKWLYQ